MGTAKTVGVYTQVSEGEKTAGTETALRSFSPADVKAMVETHDTSRTGVYREIWVGAGAMIPRTTNGAAAATVELATNDVMLDVLDFDTATEEGVGFEMAFPSVWDLDAVKAKFYWTAGSGSGGVAWGIRARANADDDAMDSAFGTEQVVTDTFITANDCHISDASAAITIGNTPAAGDLIVWEITREVANGSDTLAVDARLIGVLIQYLESSTEPTIW